MHNLTLAVALMLGPAQDYPLPQQVNGNNVISSHSNVVVGNGNVQIIINELHIHTGKTAKLPTMKTNEKKNEKNKLPPECEDQMRRHLAQVALWEQRFR